MLRSGRENGHGSDLNATAAPPLAPVKDERPPELNAMSAEALDEAEMPLPSNLQTFFLGVLFSVCFSPWPLWRRSPWQPRSSRNRYRVRVTRRCCSMNSGILSVGPTSRTRPSCRW